MGLNRWCYRVLAYATLMRNEYPPFRLDTGGTDPGHRSPLPVGPHRNRPPQAAARDHQAPDLDRPGAEPVTVISGAEHQPDRCGRHRSQERLPMRSYLNAGEPQDRARRCHIAGCDVATE